jgi:ABC-type tungstate transport system permease subunit
MGRHIVKARLESMLLAAALTLSVSNPARSADTSIILQSTTSTANSGLYEHLLPMFKQDSGITVHVVAVGTGQAIKNARNCDGDVLLVHARSAEEKFVADGFGVERFDLMYNDFIFPPMQPLSAAVNRPSKASRKLLIAGRNLPRAATIRAPTKKKWRCGRRRDWTRLGKAEAGISKPVRAWARRSTPRSAAAPMP